MEQGQVWNLSDSNIQIGIVGKTLVHYKHLKGGTKRGKNLLIAIRTLEKYLEEQRAILQGK